MQSDEVVWQIINHSHCSYKNSASEKENFCRNEYNVTGLCNRSSCPLANSQYATILEDHGQLYLVTKTVERAHTPARQWERVQLTTDYTGALEQVANTLKYWPKFLVHKNKQRLTKLAQYLIRCRRLNKNVSNELITMPRREMKRDTRKEAKAEKAAKLNTSIETQLLKRLSTGVYDSSAYKFTSSRYFEDLHDIKSSETGHNKALIKRARASRKHRELEFEDERELNK